jgi:non-ribosomal peptide synthetase component F
VVGCFINMVPVITRLDDGLSGAQVISRVSESVWSALAAQDVPFDELVQALAGPRRRGAPLFTVMFSYQVSRSGIAFGGGLQAEFTVSRPPGIAKYDLSLYAVSGDGDLRLELEYDSDLYTAATAAAILRGYRTQLAAIIENPSARIDPHGPNGFESASPMAGAEQADGRPA